MFMTREELSQYHRWYDMIEEEQSQETEDMGKMKVTKNFQATTKKSNNQYIFIKQSYGAIGDEKEKEKNCSSVDDSWIRELEGIKIPLFENKGNICYGTTILHCLMQFKLFHEVIEANKTQSGKVGEICQIVLRASHDPRNHLTEIIEKCGMKVGSQEDPGEFLQLLLEMTTGKSFDTQVLNYEVIQWKIFECSVQVRVLCMYYYVFVHCLPSQFKADQIDGVVN